MVAQRKCNDQSRQKEKTAVPLKNQDKRKKQQFRLKIKKKRIVLSIENKQGSLENCQITFQHPTKTATKHPSITLGSPKILANLANWSNWLNPKLDVGRSFNSKHKSGKNKPSPKYWWLESDEKNVYALSTSAEFLDHMCYFAFPVDFFLLLSQDLYSDFPLHFLSFPPTFPPNFSDLFRLGSNFQLEKNSCQRRLANDHNVSLPIIRIGINGNNILPALLFLPVVAAPVHHLRLHLPLPPSRDLHVVVDSHVVVLVI